MSTSSEAITQVWKAYSQHDDVLAILRDLVQEDGLSQPCVFRGDCGDALGELDATCPCLLVSVTDDQVSHDLVPLATQCKTMGVHLLVLGSPSSTIRLMDLSKLGVADYLAWPYDLEAIRSMIQASLQQEEEKESARVNTQVLTVIGMYPGIGVSTLCSHAATLLATQKETVLLDCDPLGGGAWRHFGCSSPKGMLAMFKDSSRLDDTLYRATAIPLRKRLWGLGDHLAFDDVQCLTDEHVKHGLGFLYGHVENLVIDVPYHLMHLLGAILPFTTSLALVLDESEESMQQWKRLMPVLQDKLPPSQWQLWIQRVNDINDIDIYIVFSILYYF